MAPRPVDALSAVLRALRALGATALFSALFLGMFWTPGLLLGLFALAFAADTRAFSLALERDRRRRVIADRARALRGGWIDSVATIE